MTDPRTALTNAVNRCIAEGAPILVSIPPAIGMHDSMPGGSTPEEWPCTCPDDCNCHHAHRTNYCGCKAH